MVKGSQVTCQVGSKEGAIAANALAAQTRCSCRPGHFSHDTRSVSRMSMFNVYSVTAEQSIPKCYQDDNYSGIQHQIPCFEILSRIQQLSIRDSSDLAEYIAVQGEGLIELDF